MIDLPYLQITGRTDSEKISQLIAYNNMLRDSLARVLSCIDICNLSAPLAEKINGIKGVDLKEYVRRPELNEYARLSQISKSDPSAQEPPFEVVGVIKKPTYTFPYFEAQIVKFKYKTMVYGSSASLYGYAIQGRITQLKYYDPDEPRVSFNVGIPIPSDIAPYFDSDSIVIAVPKSPDHDPIKITAPAEISSSTKADEVYTNSSAIVHGEIRESGTDKTISISAGHSAMFYWTEKATDIDFLAISKFNYFVS